MCIGTRLPTVSTALYNITIIIIIIIICHRVFPPSPHHNSIAITLCEISPHIIFVLIRNVGTWGLVSD